MSPCWPAAVASNSPALRQVWDDYCRTVEADLDEVSPEFRELLKRDWWEATGEPRDEAFARELPWSATISGCASRSCSRAAIANCDSIFAPAAPRPPMQPPKCSTSTSNTSTPRSSPPSPPGFNGKNAGSVSSNGCNNLAWSEAAPWRLRVLWFPFFPRQMPSSHRTAGVAIIRRAEAAPVLQFVGRSLAGIQFVPARDESNTSQHRESNAA